MKATFFNKISNSSLTHFSVLHVKSLQQLSTETFNVGQNNRNFLDIVRTIQERQPRPNRTIFFLFTCFGKKITALKICYYFLWLTEKVKCPSLRKEDFVDIFLSSQLDNLLKMKDFLSGLALNPRILQNSNSLLCLVISLSWYSRIHNFVVFIELKIVLAREIENANECQNVTKCHCLLWNWFVINIFFR